MLLTAAGASMACAGLYGYATQIEPFWLRVQHEELRIKGLPPNWIGKRLVHASDFHLGTTDIDHLHRTIDAINASKPDLLFLTGDFIDHSFAGAAEQVFDLFSRLRTSPNSTFACLGNHDYGSHWRETTVADTVSDSLSSLSIEVLRNRHISFERLDLCGIDDFWSPKFRQVDRLSHAALTRSHFCLCHNPDVCDLDVWNGFQGTVFAGHTHGGQCKPPFLPPPRLPIRNRNYVGGHYELSGSRKLFISKGVGYGFQARFNCRPEIHVFTLRRQT